MAEMSATLRGIENIIYSVEIRFLSYKYWSVQSTWLEKQQACTIKFCDVSWNNIIFWVVFSAA